VGFEKLEDLIGGLLGIFSSGLILEEKLRDRGVEVLDDVMDPFDLSLWGEFGEASVEGIKDLDVAFKGSGMGGDLFGTLVDHHLVGSRMDGEVFSNKIVRNRIAVGIKDHHRSLGGFGRGMNRHVVPGLFWKSSESFFLKKFGGFLPGASVRGLVFFFHPLMKGLVEGFERRALFHGVEKRFS